jgi:hypothetical protein
MESTPPPVIAPTWTFTLWLYFQQDRRDALGALARLVSADSHWPSSSLKDRQEDYLQTHLARPDLVPALREAWTAFTTALQEVKDAAAKQAARKKWQRK